jgi:serine/threonine protein kinase
VGLGRQVAIKVLNPDLVTRADIIRRFFNEARAVNRIRHPNIVDISDIQEEEALPYLVMELLEGQSLTRFIQLAAPVPPLTAVAVAGQMCDALAAVHAVGIVHRDLKTDNVMIVGSSPPRVKLLDFGISKFVTSDEGGLTGPGELLGTPQVMAPEQIRGTEVDHRIDIYAVGITLFELLTGKHPFQTDDLLTMLGRQMHDEVPRPSSQLPEDAVEPIPEALDDVVVRCLAKDPEDRFPDMRTLRRQLDRAIRGEQLDYTPPVKSRARMLAWLSLGAGLAVVLGGLLLLALWPPAKQSTAGKPQLAPPAAPKLTIQVTPPEIRTLVRSEPSGAAIYRLRDGRYLGRTPKAVALEQAEEGILLRLSKYHDKSVILKQTQAQQPTTVRLVRIGQEHADMEPDPSMARPPPRPPWSRWRPPPMPAGMAGIPAGMAGMPAGMAGMPAGMAGMKGDTQIVDPFSMSSGSD